MQTPYTAKAKKAAVEQSTDAAEKSKALNTAISQIEKKFGAGTIMRLGDSSIVDRKPKRTENDLYMKAENGARLWLTSYLTRFEGERRNRLDAEDFYFLKLYDWADSTNTFPERLELAVMDVSFISIKLVLPTVRELLLPGADLICLIKPQFEAGREEVGKKGVVRDSAVHCQVIHSILDFAPQIGLSVMGLDYSPIKGPEGNIEYICHMKNGSFEGPSLDVEAIVNASHEALV